MYGMQCFFFELFFSPFVLFESRCLNLSRSDIFNDLSSQIHESFILVNWTINPNLVQFSWNATISYQRIGIGDCLNVSENLFGPIGIDQMNTSFRYTVFTIVFTSGQRGTLKKCMYLCNYGNDNII